MEKKFTNSISLGLIRDVDMVLPLMGGIGATGGGFRQMSENFGNSVPLEMRVEFATGAIVT